MLNYELCSLSGLIMRFYLKRQSLCTRTLEQQMPLLSSVIKHATLYNANTLLSTTFRLLQKLQQLTYKEAQEPKFNFIRIASPAHYHWRGLGRGWYAHQSMHSLFSTRFYNFYHCIHTQMCSYTSSIKLPRHALNQAPPPSPTHEPPPQQTEASELNYNQQTYLL